MRTDISLELLIGVVPKVRAETNNANNLRLEGIALATAPRSFNQPQVLIEVTVERVTANLNSLHTFEQHSRPRALKC